MIELIKNEIIEIIKRPRKGGGQRTAYKCKCLTCNNTLTLRSDSIKTQTGLCGSCAQRKKPFESIYNTFMKSVIRLNKESDISFEDFLEYTKIKNCHYCNSIIEWKEYGVIKGEYKGHNYYLDRTNNEKGYTKDNVVVCCTRCNLGKKHFFSYEEWYGMTEYFRKRESKLT